MQTVIKFVKNMGPYSPGDSAGFEDVQARAYIDHGVAELVSRPDSKKLAPAAPEPESSAPAQAPAEDAAPADPNTRKGRAKS